MGRAAVMAYRIVYLVISLALLGLTIYRLRQLSKEPSPALGFDNRKSILIRVLLASVAFVVCSIDPFGYDELLTGGSWEILSGITTFLVFSVSISLMFLCIRSIALVSGKAASLLSRFNSLYVFSQVALLVSWICFPLLQLAAGYIFEVLKFFTSSTVFLLWSCGSFFYSAYVFHLLRSGSKPFYEPADKKAFDSSVFSQRLAKVKKFTLVLGIASLLSLTLVGVQIAIAVRALQIHQSQGFSFFSGNDSSFGDIILVGIFEQIKQIFCIGVCFGISHIHHFRTLPGYNSSVAVADAEPSGDKEEDEHTVTSETTALREIWQERFPSNSVEMAAA